MKDKRHEKIIELINQYDIETQDELAEHLRNAGFQVTQATVSRDIRKLKLSKVPARDGKHIIFEKTETSKRTELPDKKGRFLMNKKSSLTRRKNISRGIIPRLL